MVIMLASFLASQDGGLAPPGLSALFLVRVCLCRVVSSERCLGRCSKLFPCTVPQVRRRRYVT